MLLSFQVLAGQEWKLVWSDEFDGEALDLGKWSFQTGTGAEYGLTDWGNNEEQYYREENVNVADSVLTITAKEEQFGGKSYTSGRIRTKDKGDWTYGRVELRAKMPVGKGLWAALWMMPTDNAYGGWAASGEIDITEYKGSEPGKVIGTLHFGGSWPKNASKGKEYSLPEGDFHGEFHTFALEWEEGKMRWYVDDALYQEQGEGDWWSEGGPFPAPFDKRFHLLINLAVGGWFPGSPDASTEFPQELVVDYVRIYKADTTNTGSPAREDLSVSALRQNSPNPFRSVTNISYTLGTEEHVVLEVFDALGRKVETLVDGVRMPGTYTEVMQAGSLSPGLYTYQLRAGSYTGFRQMLLQ